MFADVQFISLLEKLYDWNEIITFVTGVIISTVFYFMGLKPQEKSGEKKKDPKKEKKQKRVKTLLAILPIPLSIMLSLGVHFAKKHYTYVPNINLTKESLERVRLQLLDADLKTSDAHIIADKKAKEHLNDGEDLTNPCLKVIDCKPKPGEFIKKGSDIELFVSWFDEIEKITLRESSIEKENTAKTGNIFTSNVDWEKMFKKVPEVREKTQEEAVKMLEGEGILWEIGELAYSDTAGEGIVFSQSPTAGAIVDKNTKVTLIISKGKELIQVPNVVGLSEKRANKKLEKARMKVTEEEEYSDTEEEGKVIRQSLNGGENVPPGTEIIIVVSKGKKPEETKAEETSAPKKPGTSNPGSPSQETQGEQTEQQTESTTESQETSEAQGTQEDTSTEDPESGSINEWEEEDPESGSIRNDWEDR